MMKFCRVMDGVLPEELGIEDITDEAQPASRGTGLKDKDIFFISFPNIDKNILIQKSPPSDYPSIPLNRPRVMTPSANQSL